MQFLGWLDILVLVAYFATAVLVGVFVSGRNKNLEAFLLGDRNLPWWAILGSIVATETSGVTVLSVPGHGFGPVAMKFLQIALGYIIGRAIIVYVLLPLYFHGQLLTAYEVLNKRFGGATRQAASLLFLIARNLGDGLRLYLVAIVLQKLAGIPLWLSVVVMGRGHAWLDTGIEIGQATDLQITASGTVDLNPAPGEAGTNLATPDGLGRGAAVAGFAGGPGGRGGAAGGPGVAAVTAATFAG
jgi:uncharacterized sodium:solute symporter family permease YidK